MEGGGADSHSNDLRDLFWVIKIICSDWYPELVSQMDEVMRAKHKRYLDNIYFGAEEIVQTEKNYNIKIRKLGTGLKAALEHNPQIAHFFEKRSDSDLISELNLQR